MILALGGELGIYKQIGYMEVLMVINFKHSQGISQIHCVCVCVCVRACVCSLVHTTYLHVSGWPACVLFCWLALVKLKLSNVPAALTGVSAEL